MIEYLNLLTPIIENAGFALTGAAIASATIWSIRRFKDYLAEKKFSLGGDYRAFYEDIVDGETITQIDTVKIKQRGYKIEVDHDDDDANRGWILVGEIDPVTQYLTGHYKAKSITDSGVGVFILEPKDNNLLDGMWAGYDSKNKQISSGRYYFERRLPIKTNKSDETDLVKIMTIAHNQLGEGYMSEKTIQDLHDNHILLVAKFEGQIIGFISAKILDSGNLNEVLKHNKDYRVPSDLKLSDEKGCLGLLQSVATKDGFTGQGVASTLVKKALIQLEKRGAQQILSIGWTTDNVHIGGVLTNCGFVERNRIKNFWSEESLREGYDCPICGEPPCECTATIFTRS